ncbi:MAG: DUF799 family lipoprotein [Nitrospiraceae bacterium]|nr:DUF799 family lipoprotein [Nitrospiraceae bacterium]
MKKLFLVFSVSMVIFSCAPSQEIKKDSLETVSIADAELPKMVAVLPFQNQTQEIGLGNKVRKSFYNHFTSKQYRDVKPMIVDEKVVYLEKSTGKSILEIKPPDICQPIGCDGLVYGNVTDFKKVFVGIYSQLSIETEVWMINVKTGKEIFRIKDSVTYHEGSVPMSPLGIIMSAVTAAMNLREIQQVRLVNELAYKLNEKVPSPKSLSKEDRPVIKEVLTNAKESPFGKGKIIRVGLEGEPGAVAMFDIGNFKKNILMKETKPGIYIGEYPVMPGDNTADMPLVAYLNRPGGLESQWIDIAGLVTLDTTPPPSVKSARAKGFHDRIEITWEPVKNTPDLKGYAVLRSEQPLSGYVELAKIELNTFEDKNAKPDTVYYYRIIASDQTGNESEVHDPVKAMIISKEPVVISGEIKKDTVLSGIYIVKGNVSVPKGLMLTIEPDTRILFAENSSLKSQGKIIINGKDSPVEFISSGEKRWKGVFIEAGNVLLNGLRIKNAVTAISLQNTEGVIENSVITESDTGIYISGTPSVAVKGSVISGNMVGVKLQKTDAKLSQNNIFQNKEGISVSGFSGEIKENNIFDNDINISSKQEIKIAANYLGSINIDEMKTNGIIISKAYENKFPEGKIADAVSNPYSKLTQEERQKKSAEILIEAGNYFRQRNYGKAVTYFEEALKSNPTAETYYYLAVCHQEMKEDDKALKYLKEGAEKFPKDSILHKSLGMMYYQKGNEAEAKKIFEEVLRLNPEDRQVKFLLERIGK